tara:strand:+ start:158 stop:313 length:156 start_codon:yes stop_codon:yes gene_type:complete
LPEDNHSLKKGRYFEALLSGNPVLCGAIFKEKHFYEAIPIHFVHFRFTNPG